ncbi:MAG: hypothetical protein QXD72_00840 [Candidatus Aenigmatarchaeota archaeon]
MENYYLGFQKIDQYTSLALDEVLTEHAIDGDNFIRMFEISPPAVTVAINEDLSDINESFIRAHGIHLTRRQTVGSAIYCDHRVFCLSIASPTANYSNPEDVHLKLASRIAQALRDLGAPPLYIGNWFSIRTTEKTHAPNVLAGFSVDWNTKSVLYHGVIMKFKQNPDFLNQLIRLRKGELKYIEQLPTLEDIIKVNDELLLRQKILERLTDGKYTQMPVDEYEDLMEKARELASSKYMNPNWISSGIVRPNDKRPHLQKGLGYCLADLFYPESKVYRVI